MMDAEAIIAVVDEEGTHAFGICPSPLPLIACAYPPDLGQSLSIGKLSDERALDVDPLLFCLDPSIWRILLLSMEEMCHSDVHWCETLFI